MPLAPLMAPWQPVAAVEALPAAPAPHPPPQLVGRLLQRLLLLCLRAQLARAQLHAVADLVSPGVGGAHHVWPVPHQRVMWRRELMLWGVWCPGSP